MERPSELIQLEAQIRVAQEEAAAEARYGRKVLIGATCLWDSSMNMDEGVLFPRGEAEQSGSIPPVWCSTFVRVPGGLWLSSSEWLSGEGAAEEYAGAKLEITNVSREIVLCTDTGSAVCCRWAMQVANPCPPAEVEHQPWLPSASLWARASDLYIDEAAPGAKRAWEKGSAAIQGVIEAPFRAPRET